MFILEARELRKNYPKVKAVDGVSFGVQSGQCFGLLGPNGAGKTTTIEMMEGITRPTSGEVLFRGQPIGWGRSSHLRHYRERAGIQFQSTALPDFLSVREVLKLFRSLYPRQGDLDEIISLCSLAEYIDRDALQLSGGQRQRLLLALALVGDPEVIFLDEPTTGLDPQARRNFWELVRTVQARGKTVILTTHYMEEAHELCDEIAIMDRGRIIAQGSPDRLLKHHFEGAVIELPREVLPGRQAPSPLTGTVKTREDHLEIQSTEVNRTLKELIEAGIPLDHVSVRSRTLEDLFLELTGKDLRA
jgi:ABC-2 type transport system ATP-binding protein